jgi:sugar lactone lactonase YvrE
MRALLVCLVSLTIPSLAHTATWPEVVARAQAAGASGDAAALESALRDGLTLRPGYPRLRYNLAAALTRRGAHDEALGLLEGLAASGVMMPVAADPAFTSLHADARWTALLQRFDANLTPRSGGREVLRHDAPRFVPEGLARDPRDGTLYLGSVHERRILRIAPDGTVSEFVAAGRDGLMSVLGMVLDARRQLLWVNSSALPEMQGYTDADKGRAALYAFALADGALVERLAAPDGVQMLGDLTLGPDGTRYASAPLDGQVFAVDASGGPLRPLATPGALASPQGTVLSADGRALVVADYAQGLMRVALADGAVTRVAVPDDLVAYGIDGLVRDGARVVAIQNGVRPHRVLSLRLDRGATTVTRWQALAVADPRWSEPTLGVLDGRRFTYVANSQWDRFDAEHRLREDPPLKGPLLLELTVP